MSDVKELCKRVIIINEGKILYDGLLEKIVNKFAPYKVIKVDFERQVSKEELETFGKVEEYFDNRAQIQIKKNEVAEKSSKLLSDFKIADLTIEDPPIEGIIREIFSSSHG